MSPPRVEGELLDGWRGWFGRRRTWALVAVLWTVPAVTGALFPYLRYMRRGEPISWLTALSWSVSPWILWALFTPLVVWLKSRFPLDDGRKIPHAVLHIIAAGVFSALHLFLSTLVLHHIPSLYAPIGLFERYQRILTGYFEFDFLIYWTILGGSYLLDYHDRYRLGSLRAVQLEAQLAHAHLQALRVQLQPHFLFNTLHAISSLMDVDVDKARRMLVRLGDLLRITLEMETIQEVPLRQELECIELYLDIERVRFPDRLRVQMLAGADALDALVPNLILQPLVENAIKHGIAPNKGAGEIKIEAARDAQNLRILILNSSPNGESPVPPGGGVGMTNVRDRLVHLYGERQSLRSYQTTDGMFGVELVLPYQPVQVKPLG